jgi:phospholipase C
MLENRSFDHIFGYLQIPNWPAQKLENLLKPGVGNQSNVTTIAGANVTFTSQRGGDYTAAGEGPSHSLKATNMQLFGTGTPTAAQQAAPPKMSGFAESFKAGLTNSHNRGPNVPVQTEVQQVMNGFTSEQLPVLSTLAQHFVLCDHWFADVPGPTVPNRAFVHAATSKGYTYNANWHPDFTGVATLYDRLDDAGITWRIYSSDSDDITSLYRGNVGLPRNHAPFATFVNDVADNALATYSFICPASLGKQYTVNSMHAPRDVRPAEKLIADIYDALKGHEDTWKETLFVIMFDEHGGYYDHVQPPRDNVPKPDDALCVMDQPYLVEFDFNRLGLRVPVILVSPWFMQPDLFDRVDSTRYSHSTIPGSIIEAYGNGKIGFLTRRDAAANKLTSKYLVQQPGQQWQPKAAPAVTVPMQPQDLDATQRAILNGSALNDPDVKRQTDERTQDIRDGVQAKDFILVQNAKVLEHKSAERRLGKRTLPTASAYNQPPGEVVSASRIAELQRPAKAPEPDPFP